MELINKICSVVFATGIITGFMLALTCGFAQKARRQRGIIVQIVKILFGVYSLGFYRRKPKKEWLIGNYLKLSKSNGL